MPPDTGSDWEGGERQPLRWGRIVAVAALVALAAVAWSARQRGALEVTTDGATEAAPVPEADLDVVVQPASSAGDRWFCPRGFEVRGYDSGRAYPLTHPDLPSARRRPTGCYRDLQRAQAAGLTVASTPPGTQMLDGIYLRPTGYSMQGACVAAATDLGYPVLCPTLAPAAGASLRCAGVSFTCNFRGGFVLEQRGFLHPGDWCDDCDGHLFVTTAPDGVRPELVTCLGDRDGPEPVRSLGTVGPATLQACPDGPPWIPGSGGFPHEGHTLASWTDDGVSYAVSVEGHGEPQVALVTRIVETAVVTTPAGARSERDG